MKIKIFRKIAIFLAINILAEICFPSIALALTGGPSQPEVESFEPIQTSQMVDPFTGDFVYNIPLLDVEGYPLNISYHSGISMDQEASWVGLGWNINPGVINRDMRGLPDDFNGDEVEKILNIKDNITVGLKGSLDVELAGAEKVKGKSKAVGGLSMGVGISYNNYKGFAMEQNFNASMKLVEGSKGSLNGGIGFRSSSQDGLDISPNVSFTANLGKYERADKGYSMSSAGSLSLGTSFNARSGLQQFSYGVSFSAQQTKYVTRLNSRGSDRIYVSGNKSSVSNGSSINFGLNTFTPYNGMTFNNKSISVRGKLGGTFLSIEGVFGIQASFSMQKLLNPESKSRAYGYLYADKGKCYDNVLMDFNREKDIDYSVNAPTLPVTNFTYDSYNVTGQGISGSFRPYRSDIGYVFDPSTKSTSNSLSLGIEFAAGNTAKAGFDLSVIDVRTKSGKWTSNNKISDNSNFNATSEDPRFEPYYFKQQGERSVDDEIEDPNSIYNKIGKDKAVKPELQKISKFDYKVNGNLIDKDDVLRGVVDKQLSRSSRRKRNQNFSYLTLDEAKKFGIQKSLYTEGNEGDKVKVTEGKKHHIGEITILKPDGQRYIYGIPAYNQEQHEVTFNVGRGVGVNKISADDNGQVTYGEKNNSRDNNHGQDNYYSKTKLPAFAHSYLLTNVVSSDFIDNDGTQGPSDGDYGTYVKFNYKKKHSNFNWRVPVGDKKANSNEGLVSKQTDDQGNYIYGSKEIWYLESVESKNYKAVFELEERFDGLGVDDENGRINNNAKVYSLKTIKLYSKNDSALKPLKTVHFEYDYSLCKGIPNSINYNNVSSATNTNGKLTLKKIYFTYKDSERGKFSPYEFIYCDKNHDGLEDSGLNPDYHPKAYDRWGTYKAIPEGKKFRYNAYYPYTNQSKEEADNNAQVWSLTGIKLPSGGEMKIDFESDDYAYVQDRHAMQMFKVVGVTNDPSKITSSEFSNELYSGIGQFKSDYKNYLIVELNQENAWVIGGDKDKFVERYLSGISDLYFRFKVNLSPDMLLNPNDANALLNPEDANAYEYVSGYAGLDLGTGNSNVGIKEIDGKTFVYFKIATEGLGDKKAKGLQVNPIVFSALQFCKLYRADIAFGTTDATDKGYMQIIDAMLGCDFVGQLKELVLGVNRNMLTKKHCKFFDKDDSIVRLVNGTNKKLGGGLRVKRIVFSDKASEMGFTGASKDYGQEYSYETYDEKLGNISSGVASYEPQIGGEENPFKIPYAIPFKQQKQQKFLVPDDRFYVEEPFGESFFPGASVGYSMVTVKSIGAPDGKIYNDHATGRTEHEFYTAKDFPTLTERTSLKPQEGTSGKAMKFLKIDYKHHLHVSQGFLIELNDMHGKQKSVSSYAEGQDAAFHKVEYFYKKSDGKLSSQFKVINRHGEVSEAQVGLEVDMVFDFREQGTRSRDVGAHGNLDAFLAGTFPGLIPLIVPAKAKETTRFRSATATKIIYRYGILEETVVHDNKSLVSTKVLALDAETGESLLNQVINNFNDPVYAFTYPAHWAYEGMGMAYLNTGLTVKNLTFSKGSATVEDPTMFCIGDEVMVLNSTDETAKTHLNNKFYVVNKNGKFISVMGGDLSTNNPNYKLNGICDIKILRSGRKNMQSLPIGNAVFLNNPFSTSGVKTKLNIDNSGEKILSAGAVEYTDDWPVYCPNDLDNERNSVYIGRSGIWKLKKNYTFLTDRNQINSETNLRNDGIYKDFKSFWKIADDDMFYKPELSDWTYVSEVSWYNPYNGQEGENLDALNRYSNASSTHNELLTSSVSSNSKSTEVYYENFENYGSSSFSIQKKFSDATTSPNSHTGKKSIKVSAGQTKELKFIPNCY